MSWLPGEVRAPAPELSTDMSLKALSSTPPSVVDISRFCPLPQKKYSNVSFAECSLKAMCHGALPHDPQDHLTVVTSYHSTPMDGLKIYQQCGGGSSLSAS